MINTKNNAEINCKINPLIKDSLWKITDYIESEGFKGYDPYDILKSPLPFHLFGKYPEAIAIQFGKRSIVNFRKIFGIKKDYNPKGLAIMLNAYCKLQKMNHLQANDIILEFIYKKLMELYSKGFSGYCWGYNFEWANPSMVLPEYYPSAVVTATVGKGLFEYYKICGKDEVLKILLNSADYLLHDLPIYENDKGICFSYTDKKKDCCFNASLLVAEFLSILYSITSNEEYLSKAIKAVEFVIAYQKNDGRWNYSMDLNTNKEHQQIDFHQGFIIESLYNFMKYSGNTDPKIINAIRRGGEFYYNNQVINNSFVKYRYPKIYPIDIHNQAQAVITFSLLADYGERYQECAKNVLLWTIKNMQEPKKGYFYYRKRKIICNKIPFIRWSQAWMLLAITTYLEMQNKN